MEANRKFAEKFSFPFPLLCDTERKIGLAYGACNTAKDEYARRVGYWIGPDGKVRKAYPAADAKTFPETVLGEIGSG